MNLKEVPMIKLATALENAMLTGEQTIINEIAGEIARRYYIPNSTVTYESFKARYGYKPLPDEKQKIMVKRIELYEE